MFDQAHQLRRLAMESGRPEKACGVSIVKGVCRGVGRACRQGLHIGVVAAAILTKIRKKLIVPALPVDKVRRLWDHKALLNWRNRARFNAGLEKAVARPNETDF